MTYIATFFSHFNAIKFSHVLKKEDISATLMPVPRRLSSSCGTCVKFTMDTDPTRFDCEDIEQLVSLSDDSYVVILSHI